MALVAGATETSFPQLLPPELREYLDSQEWTTFDWASALVALVSLVSIVGLWLVKNWARWLYTLTTVAYFVVGPFVTPTVMSAPAYAFDELSLLCSGGVIVLVWFSQLKEEFLPNPGLNRTRKSSAPVS